LLATDLNKSAITIVGADNTIKMFSLDFSKCLFG